MLRLAKKGLIGGITLKKTDKTPFTVTIYIQILLYTIVYIYILLTKVCFGEKKRVMPLQSIYQAQPSKIESGTTIWYLVEKNKINFFGLF